MFDPSVLQPTEASIDKRFTLDEANRSLTYLTPIAADIAAVYQQILELRSELDNLDPGELREVTEREYRQTMDRLGELVDELHAVGVELRDFERGRVEFPASHDGQDILLIWERGESEIQSWRDPESAEDVTHPVESLQVEQVS
jgi:hypothetical protein